MPDSQNLLDRGDISGVIWRKFNFLCASDYTPCSREGQEKRKFIFLFVSSSFPLLLPHSEYHAQREAGATARRQNRERTDMTFGEKVRNLRQKCGLSQEQLAEKTGVTKRTVRGWETESRYPRRMEIYDSLAQALGCSAEYLRGEQEAFYTKASEEYGSRGMRQAQEFLEDAQAMFAGGDLSPEDIDMVGRHFMEMFWEAKENTRKYTPKKYRKTSDSGDDAASSEES